MCEEFGIKDKVFKIVADQAKNVKNAFQETKSKVDLQDVTLLLLIKQRQMDRDAELETSARNKIQAEINKMNEPIELDNSNEQPTKKLKRDQVLDDLDFSLDELTDEVEEEDELSDTLNGSSEEYGDFEDEAAELAYIPCSCHNVQLIIGDGIKDLDEKYQALLSKCTKDIVGKSKMSSIIADELRKIDIKLCQKCETRWNTILFVARSCLKPNPEQYKLIRDSMNNKTAKEKEARKNFGLTLVERDMLSELVKVLEMFEFLTKELQGNKVSISRVYPGIVFLRQALLLNVNDYKYTQLLREDLVKSIDKRFGNLIQNDLFLVSTFLDPNFGISYIEIDKQNTVKKTVKSLLRQMSVSVESTSSKNKFIHPIVEQRKSNYICHNTNDAFKLTESLDELDNKIDEYLNTISQIGLGKCYKIYSFNIKVTLNLFKQNLGPVDALVWWKENQFRFTIIADLAKKFLGVQASSSGPERMFSIAGHIMSIKRRKLGIKIFENLVILKLNSHLLNLINFTSQ